MPAIPLLPTLLLLLPLYACSDASSGDDANSDLLQKSFDPVGPSMRTATAASGRTVNYLDEGEGGWHPVVFIGGGGTSGRVFTLLEFLRTTRQNLQLRFIAVERNGFGATPYTSGIGYEEYAEDVESLLEQLGIDNFSLFAISGGGPYSAYIASRNPGRLSSVHMAATLSYFDDSVQCLLPKDALTVFTQDPVAWFGFAPDSPTQRIPGFQDEAFDDAARTFNLGGQAGDPEALYHELQLYCQNLFIPDLSAVTAPLYLYYGESDDVVPIEPHAQRWQAAYANAPQTIRYYPGEGHDVQYRHMDQIFVDISGRGDRLVTCNDQGESVLIDAGTATPATFLGICAWRD